MSIVTWDSLDATIQSQIEMYYLTLWSECAISICSDHVLSVKQAYSKSQQEMIRHGIPASYGYVVLKWDASETDDDKADISIIAGNPFPLSGGATERADLAKMLVRFGDIAKQDKIPVYSSHYDPTNEKLPNGVTLFYKDPVGEDTSIRVDTMPFGGISTGVDLSIDEEIKQRQSKRSQQKSNQKPLELQKEDELYDWLRVQGVNVERQVKTSSGHVLDLWIAGKVIIELKRGSVTANDVCQSIEYASEYSLPIILIGERITGNASRGLAGFNRLCPDQKISYVSWDIARDFLRGMLMS